MKIKNLKDNPNMRGIKVKTLSGVIGYWKSQWEKGVWLSDNKTTQIYPQLIDDLRDCLEWEIAEEDEEVNCNKLRDLKYIDNRTLKD